MSKDKSPKWLGLNKKIRWGRAQVPAFKDEEAWRAMLESVGGNRSLGAMDEKNMARVVDHLAREFGVEFESKSARPYKARACARRSDFYEIPDGVPHAARKRKLCMIWRELGYALDSLDSRVHKQFGCEAFVWLSDKAAMDTLARDLNKRLKAKRNKEAEALECARA